MADRKIPKIFQTLFPYWFKPQKKMGEETVSGELLFTGQKNIWEFYHVMTETDNGKQERIKDYEQMIEDPIVFAATELVSEDSFLIDDQSRSLTVNANKKIKDNTLQLFDDFDIEGNLVPWAFGNAFYGEVPLLLDGEPDRGITDINSDIHPLDFYRVQSGSLFGFMTTYRSDGKEGMKMLSPWDMVHIYHKRNFKKKLMSELKKVQVGKKQVILDSFDVIGYLEPIRKIYKKIRLVEDSLVLARLDRAPLKRVFYIDVGNADPKEKIKIIQEFKRNYKNEVGFSSDGYYRSDKNPMTYGQELFIPISNGVKGITTAEYGGNTDVKAIVDVDFLMQKFYGGLKTPKSILGLCLRGNTKISLIDGTEVPIKEIYDNKERYIGKGIYTCSREGEVSVAPIASVTKPRKDSSFVRVYLDNEEFFDVTPDHPIQLRSGSFMEAQNLKEGDSLMPLNRKVNSDGYESFQNNIFEKSDWIFTHRETARVLSGGKVPEGQISHHKDRVKRNNDFSNIEVLTKRQHAEIHMDQWIKAMERGNFIRLQRIINGVEYSEETLEKWRNCGRKNVGRMLDVRTNNEEVNKKWRDRLSKVDKSYNAGIKNVMNNPEVREKARQGTKESFASGNRKPIWTHIIDREDKKFKDAIAAMQNARWPGGSTKVEFEITCACCGRIFKRRLSKYEVEKGYLDNPRFCSVVCQRRTQSSVNREKILTGNNHKVIKVEFLDVVEDAYDIRTASSDHCFALSVGVFVHNTDELPGSLGESALVRLEIRYARVVKANRRGVMSGLYRLAQIHNAWLGVEVGKDEISISANSISTAEEEELRSIFGARVESTKGFLDLMGSIGVKVNEYNEKMIKYVVYDLLKMTSLDFKVLSSAATNDPTTGKELKETIEEDLDIGKGLINRRDDCIYEVPTSKSRIKWEERFERVFSYKPDDSQNILEISSNIGRKEENKEEKKDED